MFALLLILGMATASTGAQYYCVAPPSPCQTLTALNSWSFVPEAAAPHYLHVIANGHDYGRVARGTAWNVPNSVIVTDAIFSGTFQ